MFLWMYPFKILIKNTVMIIVTRQNGRSLLLCFKTISEKRGKALRLIYGWFTPNGTTRCGLKPLLKGAKLLAKVDLIVVNNMHKRC